MTRLHPEDETVDDVWHDPDTTTALRDFGPGHAQVADILGLGRRLNEREWRAVVALAALVEGVSGPVSAEPPACNHLLRPSVARNVTNERRSA